MIVYLESVGNWFRVKKGQLQSCAEMEPSPEDDVWVSVSEAAFDSVDRMDKQMETLREMLGAEFKIEMTPSINKESLLFQQSRWYLAGK
jgi:hypothetical protein